EGGAELRDLPTQRRLCGLKRLGAQVRYLPQQVVRGRLRNGRQVPDAHVDRVDERAQRAAWQRAELDVAVLGEEEPPGVVVDRGGDRVAGRVERGPALHRELGVRGDVAVLVEELHLHGRRHAGGVADLVRGVGLGNQQV